MVVKTTIGELISTIDRELGKAKIKNNQKRQKLLAYIFTDILTQNGPGKTG
ncbi:MAG: hypothetical protein WCG27_10175 [Pseudomonadota bacterium]